MPDTAAQTGEPLPDAPSAPAPLNETHTDAPSAPAPLNETHIPVIAAAAQQAHYPDFVGELEDVAPQYINDAKAFVAMFNTALTILGQVFPAVPPAPSSSNAGSTGL